MHKKKPILYIEDDPNSLEIVQFILNGIMGFEHVTGWSSSEDIIEKLRELNPYPYLILMDIQMAPHDGYAVMKMIKESPEFQEIKIVALTASFMKEEVKRLKQAGFDGGIAKPIDRDTFPDFIETILSGEAIWHISGEVR